ncbi:hypothetical protein I4U23_025928 [Adineta vaga]|nr:hypothetical protein I4U23_025928 [Adineta vaga]
MVKVQILFRSIPRRYRHYPYILSLICILIFLICYRNLQQFRIGTADDKEFIHGFDLFDDDDLLLSCSTDIHFNISNRRHLAVMIGGPQLVPFLWKNFHALLCTGVDVYIMFDQPYHINSSHTNRSFRSYTHRFLHVSNETLDTYGVRYMTKFPRLEYTAWDRAVVWLYHRRSLTTAWLINYGVQWVHVHNMTYLFDSYAKETTDLLCVDIVRTESSFWKQWPKTESDIFPKSDWLGVFAPITRWSRRLLFHHYRYMQLIHKKRLHRETDLDFRFQEFLMGTIANIEKLAIATFNQKHDFLHITLSKYNQTDIVALLRQGKHILHPIAYDSILTNYSIHDKVKLMKINYV